MIGKDEFLKKYHISDDLFQSAEMKWQDLMDIYHDFKKKQEKYEKIMNAFDDAYLKPMSKKKNDNGEKEIKIHSIHSRIKEPEHLIAKIIRKKQENQKKYKELNKDNYEKFLTDLIGIRCLILFKSDWQSFHSYIISQFDDNKDNYIKNPIRDFDEDSSHNYIAEPPKVHIRNGDSRKIYEELLPPDSVLDGKVYRSVHYILKYQGVYLEIQVRTLFEEAWGEIDHAIVYPDYQEDRLLNEYTGLLNRLSGLADEMSDFFTSLKVQKENNDFKKETIENNIRNDMQKNVQEKHEKGQQTFIPHTGKECLDAVMKE